VPTDRVPRESVPTDRVPTESVPTDTVPTDSVPTDTVPTGERADLVSALDKHRHFLRLTVSGLDDEQAARRTTVSELCLGGLIKHVTEVESGWADFILEGPTSLSGGTEGWDRDDVATSWLQKFQMLPGERLADLLERYEDVARRTDRIAASVDLDAGHPLPEAPWFEPGVRWSARRVLLHIIAETAQHAGHADIIREALDGSKSMG